MFKTKPKPEFKQVTFASETVLKARITSLSLLGKGERVDRYYSELAKGLAGKALYPFDVEGVFRSAVDASSLKPDEYYHSAVLDLEMVIRSLAGEDFAAQVTL